MFRLFPKCTLQSQLNKGLFGDNILPSAHVPSKTKGWLNCRHKSHLRAPGVVPRGTEMARGMWQWDALPAAGEQCPACTSPLAVCCRVHFPLSISSRDEGFQSRELDQTVSSLQHNSCVILLRHKEIPLASWLYAVGTKTQTWPRSGSCVCRLGRWAVSLLVLSVHTSKRLFLSLSGRAE